MSTFSERHKLFQTGTHLKPNQSNTDLKNVSFGLTASRVTHELRDGHFATWAAIYSLSHGFLFVDSPSLATDLSISSAFNATSGKMATSLCTSVSMLGCIGRRQTLLVIYRRYCVCRRATAAKDVIAEQCSNQQPTIDVTFNYVSRAADNQTLDVIIKYATYCRWLNFIRCRYGYSWCRCWYSPSFVLETN